MQWLIQCTGLPDIHTLRLLETVKALGQPCIGIGIIPFSHEITGLDEADPNAPSMFYGSTTLIAKVKDWEFFRPGCFWDEHWYDPRCWIGKRNDLLNSDLQLITAGALRRDWVKEPMFVKSIEQKLLTGMVIEPEKEDHDNWIIEQSALDANDLLIMSPCKNIETECRFFIVDGKIVAGSTYRWNGVHFTTRPIDGAMINHAIEAVHKWLPSPNIVMDTCRLKNGEYKVVEFNSINSSGFYNCDVKAIVKSIESKFS